MMHEGRSEVANLRAQIEVVCHSMNQMLYGYACNARHDFINRKYTALGYYQEQLEPLVGEQQAIEIVVDTYNRVVQ